jgi:hypothetical protein
MHYFGSSRLFFQKHLLLDITISFGVNLLEVLTFLISCLKEYKQEGTLLYFCFCNSSNVAFVHNSVDEFL